MAGDKIGSSSSEGSDKRTDKRNRREDGSLPLRDIRAMLGTGPSSFAHTLAELSGKLAFES
jgi:hypothetical protein